jgi:mRNA-degrading endonuclease HigB of HigAB toxin-antitoxin module
MEVVYPSNLRNWAEEYKSNQKVGISLSTWLVYMKTIEFKNINELRLGKFSPDVVHTNAGARVPERLVRVVWNICGNEFRLIGHVGLKGKEVFLKGFYTHGEYEALNLSTLNYD